MESTHNIAQFIQVLGLRIVVQMLQCSSSQKCQFRISAWVHGLK